LTYEPGKDPMTADRKSCPYKAPSPGCSGHVTIQWSSEVKWNTLKEANDLLALVGSRERTPMRMLSMPVNPNLASHCPGVTV
jgi:hypothetical protein